MKFKIIEMQLIIKQFFKIQENLCDLVTFSERYNISLATLRYWKRPKNTVFDLQLLNDVLNQLGYELQINIKKDAFK